MFPKIFTRAEGATLTAAKAKRVGSVQRQGCRNSAWPPPGYWPAPGVRLGPHRSPCDPVDVRLLMVTGVLPAWRDGQRGAVVDDVGPEMRPGAVELDRCGVTTRRRRKCWRCSRGADRHW